MKMNFELIKQIVTCLSTGTCLVTFIVTTLCTNTKSPNFIEYTDLSKFFLNFYIFILLLICFCHAVYPKLVCILITNSLGIIITDRGKIALIASIIVMYFSTESMPQKLFGMISFVAVFGLYLADLLLNCDILKQKPLINNAGNNSSKNSDVIITNTENVANVINNPLDNKN